jgi:adenylate cyclase
MDFAEAGLLDGIEDDEREQREKLLQRLADDGFTLEQLTKATQEHRLALLPVDQILQGRYSAEEVERRTDLPEGMMVRIRRLHGLPSPESGDTVFTDEDIQAARSMKIFLDAGFDEERISEITRVLGESMARVAATVTAAFARTFLHPGDSEADVALRFAELAEQLTPAVTPILAAAFKAHLRDSVSRGMLGRAQLEAGDVGNRQDVTVCFADLVGFTRLGSRVEVLELGTVAGRLSELAAAVTEAPVRLIKTIGDAAMFVSPEPGPLVGVALKLVEAFENEDLPSLRAGIAYGPAVISAGDFYGNSVNLASRVTGVARPGSVLCTQEVHDAAPDDYDWSRAGRYRLKGVSGQTPLYRARPLGSADVSPKSSAGR